MKSNSRSFPWPFRLAGWAFLLSAVVLGLASPVQATDVTVDCDGNEPPFDFTSIQAAIDSLDQQGPHTIFVKPGTCTENVEIIDRERLRIEGPSTGGPAFIESPSGENVTIRIENSRGISLHTLTVRGGANGYFIGRASEVFLQGQHIWSNGEGINLQSNSTLRFEDGVVELNDRAGLTVANESLAEVHSVRFSSNQEGILAFAGRLQLFNSELEGNTLRGVWLLGGTTAEILNTQIHDNGSLGPAFGAGGVLTAGNSTLGLIESDVSNNRGFGIVARDNSSAALTDSTVTANSAGGVIVLILSSARLLGTNNITGNGNTDLTCTISSFAYGNGSGVRKLLCPGFSTDPFPGPLL